LEDIYNGTVCDFELAPSEDKKLPFKSRRNVVFFTLSMWKAEWQHAVTLGWYSESDKLHRFNGVCAFEKGCEEADVLKHSLLYIHTINVVVLFTLAQTQLW